MSPKPHDYDYDRLQSFQESTGQVGSGQEDGQRDRKPPGTQDTHRIYRKKYHESQMTFEIVKALF